MKKRVMALLLGAVLLTGCVMRPTAAQQVTPAPVPIPTEPTPTAAPTPTPEPTPCPHAHWTDGVCDDCGEVCSHEAWENGACAVCRLGCAHPAHDEKTRRCTVCGEQVTHTYWKGQCTRCGAAPVFLDEILPRELFTSTNHPGRLVTLHYTTHDYRDLPGQAPTPIEKQMVVYLPWGYDPAEQYDLLILVHGMGGTERYWLSEPQDYNYPEEDYVFTTDLLDSMMDDARCKRMIVAAPCFYRDNANMGNYYVPVDEQQFLFEMREDILPLLLETYSTYAPEPTLEGMTAAREHFAYAGLSMGSIYAFTSFIPECQDLFGWFGCFSGSDGAMFRLAPLIDAAAAEGMPIYYMYNSIGTNDTMLNGHVSRFRELISQSESLVEGENAALTVIHNARHTYEGWGTGLYNFLPVVFSLPEEAGTA